MIDLCKLRKKHKIITPSIGSWMPDWACLVCEQAMENLEEAKWVDYSHHYDSIIFDKDKNIMTEEELMETSKCLVDKKCFNKYISKTRQ